ncbi:hypothetical protein DRN84_02855 [Candidatus Geothermarchaeota archaeon]|nr:MAG: hypothetical protein DRN84_02855 [Candidatus Geothermarchaeota archaeon]
MSIRISLLLFTYNNSRELDALLSKYSRYFDEIVVVDSYSEDDILSVARKYNVRLYRAPRLGYQDPLFNYGVSLCNSEWIMNIDLDEMPSHTLVSSLRRIVEYADSKGYKGISTPFLDVSRDGRFFMFEGDKVKIFRKGYVWFTGNVHDKPRVYGEILNLSYPNLIIHDFLRNGWIKHFKKHVKYLYLTKFSTVYNVSRIPIIPKLLKLDKILSCEVPRIIIALIWILNPLLTYIKYIRGFRRMYTFKSIMYRILLSMLYHYPHIFRSGLEGKIAHIVSRYGISNILKLNSSEPS